ncbi:glycoside hydrolase [Enterocloster clostridioformis]|uniref:Glycoside hydrolase n=1 Tax=Enterocloster clostridioformis TaxID=1531 RepID=A0A2X2U8G4_9FIRM|nr:hypothetical protein [Enterocloster clostridioformis]SQB10031.1 glycoside hydrolase [Enterocloster clostridioformis]
MLSVRQNESRMAVELGGIWNFKLDQETSAARAPMPGLLRDGEPVAVPASYNDQKDVMEYRDHYGWAYYQRTLTVPILLKGRDCGCGSARWPTVPWCGWGIPCSVPIRADFCPLRQR